MKDICANNNYKNSIEKLSYLRNKYLDCSTGLTIGLLENKLKAKLYLLKIKNHKIEMKKNGYI